MVQTIGRIYEQGILPQFTIPYFSDNFHAEETWLSSVIFPPLDYGQQKQYLSSDNTIPPYNIQHHIQSHSDFNEYDPSWFECIQVSCKITAIVEELSSINRAKCYTHFLEYHLLAYARYFHRQVINKAYLSRPHLDNRLTYFALWFSYAHPSTKIMVGVWTSCYLLRRLKLTWHPPVGFCSGAISFLEVQFQNTYFLHPSH